MVGVVTGIVWWVWQPLWTDGSVAGAVVAFGTAGVAAISLAVIHDRGLTRFGQVWRSVGALLGMVGLFIAAVPYTTTEDFEWNGWLVGAIVVAAIAAAGALVVARGRARLEPLVAIGVLAVAGLMVLWDTGTDTSTCRPRRLGARGHRRRSPSSVSRWRWSRSAPCATTPCSR